MGLALVHRWRHVAGVGTCGRVWGYVTGGRGMWQGWWQGVGACGRGGHVIWGQAYGKDEDMWQGGDMWHGVGACGRVWEQVAGVVAGCGGMWQE